MALHYSLPHGITAVVASASNVTASIQHQLRCYRSAACSLLGRRITQYSVQQGPEENCNNIRLRSQEHLASTPLRQLHVTYVRPLAATLHQVPLSPVIMPAFSPWCLTTGLQAQQGSLQHAWRPSAFSKGIWLQHSCGLNQQQLAASSYAAASTVHPASNRHFSSASPLLQTVNQQPRHMQHQGSGAVDAKVLTTQITKCRSLQMLQHLIGAHSQSLNHIHVTAMVVQLARLSAHPAQQLQDSPEQQAANTSALHAMQQLWPLVKGHVPNYSSREVSSIIYSILRKCPAVVREQYQQAVLQDILPAFLQRLPSAAPQAVSNVLYAVASSGQQLHPQHVQQFIKRLVDTAGVASPQAISNSLWAVATMQQRIADLHVHYLVGALIAKAMYAKPHEISAVLWALVMLRLRLPEHQLVQLQDALCSKMTEAPLPAVVMAVWACGHFSYLPKQVLSHPQLFKFLATAEVQSLVNLAWACGHLGHRDAGLIRAIIHHIQRRLQDKHSFHPMQLSLLPTVSWAVAVLGLQQLADDAKSLIARVPFDSKNNMQLQQLYQIHMWLQDIQHGDAHGLLGVLDPAQIQCCRTACSSMNTSPQCNNTAVSTASVTSLQQQVFKALCSLQITWQEAPRMEQSSSDGLLVVDIVCRTAAGQLVAIEVDGPSHFVAPDNTLTGPTLYRNAALQARGYTVISIPYFEWTCLGRGRAQKQYLMQRLGTAGVHSEVMP